MMYDSKDCLFEPFHAIYAGRNFSLLASVQLLVFQYEQPVRLVLLIGCLGLCLGVSQVQFHGPAHSFTSCQLLVKG